MDNMENLYFLAGSTQYHYRKKQQQRLGGSLNSLWSYLQINLGRYLSLMLSRGAFELRNKET